MKIGILTFHRSFNYGAVLQTLGLVDALKDEYPDAEIEVIDYYNKRVQELCRSFYMAPGNKVLSFVKAILRYPERSRKKKNYDEFVENNIKLSSRSFYSFDELESIKNDYDIFITGSDQVWNHVCGYFDKAYFLTFVEDVNKKVSYAASFGFKEMPNGYEDEYRNRLSNFTKISVREQSGCKILDKLDGRESSICVDPTLLRKKSDWEKYVGENKEKSPYIFVYSVLEPAFQSQLVDIAKKTGKKVIYLKDAYRRSNKYVKYIRGISPTEFLSYIYHADMVLTNSFHGTVFSTIFEKQFFVETKNGKYENDRIINLLNCAGITGREIKDQNWDNLKLPETNWEEVKNNIGEKRTESISFINDNVA